MPFTSLSNLVYQDVLREGAILESLNSNTFYTSGVVVDIPALEQGPMGGHKVALKHWVDIDGASENVISGTALTVNNVSAVKQEGVVLLRGKAWGADDTAAIFSGEDPLAFATSRIGAYWGREEERILIRILRGIAGVPAFAANNVMTVAGTLTPNDLINAQYMLGEYFRDLTAIAVHPKTMALLHRLDLITFIRPSALEGDIPTYFGKKIIVDESLPVDSGTPDVYWTVLFGQGAFGRAEGRFPNGNERIGTVGMQTETDRDTLKSQEYLVTRRAFVLHPAGFSYTGSITAGQSPSDTDLSNSANWTYVYPNTKYTKLVIVKHQV